MVASGKPTNILLAWVGQTDLKAAIGNKEAGIGPIAQAMTQRRYDLAVLLSNYPKSETTLFVKWLEPKVSCPIEMALASLSSPTHFGEIYKTVTAKVNVLRQKYGEAIKLTYHLSPGTPAMAAVWIIVAKTRFPAELVESSRDHGVKSVSIPFEMSAEYVPEFFRGPDRDLSALASGEVPAPSTFGDIVYRSETMARAISKARKAAVRNVPILIEGESGTGKELLARAIHNASLRHSKPFIPVNCGAVSPELVESEFFGHKKGAFTGAAADRTGHFEEADGGTLFLDEIGELPLSAQVKLLRALEAKQVVAVGATRPRNVDVRIVAATNRNLAHEVAAGRFREDLFYRLAVAVLRLPPLRERIGDLSLLIDHLLGRVNSSSTAETAWVEKKLSSSAKNLLLNHPWPGNVRELLNTLTRAAIWSEGAFISKEELRDALLDTSDRSANVLDRAFGDGVDLQGILAEVARHYLERAMSEAGGNKTKAAELLGLPSYQTLKNWLAKYGINA
ncbi:MAG: sigma-54-dependent Fis family transcriptional regulator [Gammaproteobacteria bacterium]|nr:sigma-54-dependent Fis family transcriptional regulator [Gammaproteobacteria bacterium]